MYNSKVEICIVLTNNIPTEIEEILTNELNNAEYKINQFQSIEEFLSWYLANGIDIFLITNESSNSETYMTLKKEYPDLRDCILIEPEEEIPSISAHSIFFDSENADIDIDGLLEVIDSSIRMLENKRLIDEDFSHFDSGEDLPMDQYSFIEDDDDDDEDDTEQGKHLEGAGERNTLESQKPEENLIENKEEINQQDNELKTADTKTEHNEKNKEPVPDIVPEDEVKSSFQNNPFPMRLRNIQKSLSGPKMDKYKTIGVWSPLPAIGVTSFLINFSLFLAENKVHTAVLESLTTNHILKDWLKRYTPIPDKWVSLATNLHAAEPVGDSEWLYRGVKFFPLNKDDVKQDWNSDSFGAYHRLTEIYDVTLIDMPTGEMSVFTKESLEYMDELWIIVDDRVQQLNSWKDYIKQIKQNHNISIHLIHNKLVASSKPNILCEGMGVTMLTTIPALWEETAMNYYQNKPLYLQKNVQPILQPPYHQLATHLIGSSFQLQEKKPTMWEQIAKIGKFQNILNG
ncbi:hypothetical protein [Planomicrobium okeanokoites]|uniref:hypothetical protein n=1 Tax=Planomicrobium okeanokoites TaxID=244 RepID=UPI00248F8E23|nr:hypothetical protein [Planomicrobium okeanokoites]